MTFRRESFINRNRHFLLAGLILFGSFVLLGILQVVTQDPTLMGCSFYFMSVLMTLFLLFFGYSVYRSSGVKISRTSGGIILAASLLCFAQYAVVVINKPLMYAYDSTIYYKSVLQLLQSYAEKPVNVFQVCVDVYNSIVTQNYPYVITVFSAFPFFLSDMSAEAYILCTALVVIPILFFEMGCLMIKIGSSLHFQANKLTLLMVLCYAFLLSFPLLHISAMGNRPDYWGLIFIFPCILLTWDKTFETLSVSNCIVLFVSLWFTVVTRRWYLYWAASYGLVIGIRTLAAVLRKPGGIRKRTFRKYGWFVVAAVLSIFGSLFPMFLRIFTTNYTVNYKGYWYGGLAYEIANQYHYLGLLLIVIMSCGFLFTVVKNHGLRANAITYLGIWGCSIFMFTRVQNMGMHQSLLLAPTYIIFAFFAIAGVLFIPINGLRRLSLLLLSSYFILSAYNNLTLQKVLPDVTSQLTYREMDQTLVNNKTQIQEVADFMISKKEEKATFYFICHDPTSYNASLFRESILPSLALDGHIISGGALYLVASSSFPKELFANNYVVTCEPYLPQQTALTNKLQAAFFNSPWFSTAFSFEKTIDMGNGYHINFYRRISPYSWDELDYYYNQFADERERYPDLYESIFSELRHSGNLYTRPEWQLPAPQGLKSTAATVNSITLSWDSMPGAGSYRLYINGDRAADISGTSCISCGLAPNTVYTIMIKAISDTGMVGIRSGFIGVRTKK